LLIVRNAAAVPDIIARRRGEPLRRPLLLLPVLAFACSWADEPSTPESDVDLRALVQTCEQHFLRAPTPADVDSERAEDASLAACRAAAREALGDVSYPRIVVLSAREAAARLGEPCPHDDGPVVVVDY
jgi:hypothetical protein